MPRDDEALRRRLRGDLRHRLRPMSGRDPDEPHRAATPLELLYDLTYVIAFAAAAEQLAHHLGAGEVAPALGAYLFAVFAVSWAWMSFTWFSSAYGNDDALFRVATIVQMIGVIVLTFGLPVSFEGAVEGESPHNTLTLVGYLVMRLPLLGLWLRAARQDRERGATARAYAAIIAVAQLAWVVIVVVPAPTVVSVAALVLLAVAEMVAPVVAERRLGRAPWNAGHVAERFGLLTLITLGEVIAATTTAVGALTGEEGWSAGAVVVVSSGLVLAAAIWWAYFLIPSRPILETWPERTYLWRYAHLPIFGSIAAIGAGLRVSAEAVHGGELTLLEVTAALALPVGAVLVTIFATWSVLMHAYDLSHVPLFAATLVPLVAALVVAAAVGTDQPLEAADSGQLAALIVVIALIALSTVVEVVGHEAVGFRHTVRVVDADERAEEQTGGPRLSRPRARGR